MSGSIFLSILFIISFLLFYLSVFLFRKTDKKQNAVLWATPVLFICLFLLSSASGVVNIFFNSANIVTASVICLIFAAVFWYFIIVKKQKQAYFFSVSDFVLCILILGITAVYARGEFTSLLAPLYETSDPAVHLQLCMDVLNTGSLGKMYFAPLMNSLAVGTFSFAFEPIMYYKIFVLTDIAYFALSGLAVYSFTALKMPAVYRKITAFVLTFFYMIGYPLNNMVFGFNYLGLSVSCIAVVLLLLNCFDGGGYNKKFIIICLSCAMASVAMCYILFAPIVFLTGFVIIARRYAAKKQLFSLKHISEQLCVFLFPSFLAVYYSLFKTGAVSMVALANEGYIYRDLISNFFMLLVPTALGIVKMFKDKKLNASFLLFALAVLQIAVTFVLGLKGYFSSYYAYKTYYVLWLVCFCISGEYISVLEKKDMYIPTCYLLCVLMLFGISETEIENKISEKNVLFCPRNAAYGLFDIYHSNTENIFDGLLCENIENWNAKVELFGFVNQNLNPQNNIYIAASYNDVYWYEALTNQRFATYVWAKEGDFNRFYDETEYAVIIPDSAVYNDNKELFDNYSEILFENSVGFVVKK